MTNFYIEPTTNLLENIIKRIHHEERVLVLRRIAIFSITFTVSVAGFIPSLKMLLSDFSQSGFLRFFSLLFSDSTTVATYWQSFALILLESLPAISLAVFLAVLFMLLQSLKFLTKDVNTIIRATA